MGCSLKFKCISYNIDGLANKLLDNSFLEFLEDFDIICLVETFMANNDLPKHLFSSFCKPAFFSKAFRLSTYGRCSGGVIVLIKQTLRNLVNIIELDHEFDNIIALKFSKILSSQDVIFLFTYVQPYGSQYYDQVNFTNGIFKLEECISKLQILYNCSNIVVCGDLNSRTSSVQPIDETIFVSKYLDDYSTSPLTDNDVVYSRRSEDKLINTFGHRLLEMCGSLNLVILNGHSDGDKEGNFTNITHNGNSVVDYFIVSDSLVFNVDMSVKNEIYSSHMPIVLYFNINTNHVPENVDQSKLYKNVTKYVWMNDKVDIFIDHFKLLETSNAIDELSNTICDNVNECISNFNSIMLEASNCMLKTFHCNTKNNNHNAWYDLECSEKRKIVKNSLRLYRKNRNFNTKQQYVESRKTYKSMLKQKKYNYSIKKITLLANNVHDPRKFWKDVKYILGNKAVQNNIPIEFFFHHFSSVFNCIKQTPTICHEPVCLYFDDDVDHQLNIPISIDEIKSRLSKLNPKKGAGPDNISNEMLHAASPFIVEFLLHIFQYLFINGIYPLEWTKSIIIPIHKKGNINNCDNYRPISLTSLLSKLYTGILNERLTDFIDTYNILPEEQAGFRKEFSTTDHIFSLYAMVIKQFHKNRKLYVAFIDYRKCFDSIDRNALFLVLERNGIKGPFLQAIKSLYDLVTASVRNNNVHSDYFNCPTGVKQGCLLSTSLFNIFMTELSKSINREGRHGIQLSPGNPILHHLLYADDNVLFSDTPSGLQAKLNILYTQSTRLGLEVNLDKSKIIVFRKGGRLSKHEHWFYNKTKVEVVNSYCYLGVNFTTKMNLCNLSSSLISKAKNAGYCIIRSLKNLQCADMNIFCKLFDSKVLPILTYGSELHGALENTDIEKVHTNILKQFLNVSLNCSNSLLYYESGRFPIHINIKIKSIKYWFRLLKLPPNRICKQAYSMLERLDTTGKNNWVTNIKDLLCKNGFGIVWMFKGVGNEKQFFNLFRDRLRDCFIQGLESRLETSTHFEVYNGFKSYFVQEQYLSNIMFGKSLANTLAKFRMGVSSINAHRHKFNNNPNSRLCPFCSTQTEDEIHIVFLCPVYENIRIQYLHNENVNQPSLANMNAVLRKSSFLFAKYLYDALRFRYKLLN